MTGGTLPRPLQGPNLNDASGDVHAFTAAAASLATIPVAREVVSGPRA